MRIERVTADTFSEASEQARQRYGSEALILSTNKVGNITELLVCVEAEDDGFVPAPGFREELSSQIAKALPKRASGEVPVASATKPAADAPVAAAPVDGSALVKAIRQELQALEKRLSSSSGTNALMRERIAMLEQGVSSQYAMRLLDHIDNLDAMAQQVIDDLAFAHGEDMSGYHLVGPAGAGKTTLAIQLSIDTGMVQSWRDTRPGSRERFFAMTDRAGVEAGWGAKAPTHAIIDSAGASLGELQEKCENASLGERLILVLPATISRSEALRWLQSSLPIAGVMLTHWDAARMPLGLLTTIAECGKSLWGVSSSADPSARLQPIDAAAIKQGLGLILQLALSEPQHATE
jgi:flagellar biosynthesis GTPase FlhF